MEYTDICSTCAYQHGGKVEIGKTAIATVGECQMCGEIKWLYHPIVWTWKNKKTRDKMVGPKKSYDDAQAFPKLV